MKLKKSFDKSGFQVRIFGLRLSPKYMEYIIISAEEEFNLMISIISPQQPCGVTETNMLFLHVPRYYSWRKSGVQIAEMADNDNRRM